MFSHPNVHMFLTLDESTLFYWMLSDESHTGEKRKHQQMGISSP